MEHTFINNDNWQGAKKRYELHVDGNIAFVEYFLIKNEKAYLVHTEVPKELSGMKIGFELVQKVLDDLADKNIQVVPICPFVAAFIKRHKEYANLVSPEFKYMIQ